MSRPGREDWSKRVSRLNRWAWRLGVVAVVLVLAIGLVPMARMRGSGAVGPVSTGTGSERLAVGAGEAPVAIPFPVVVAGYGTVRPEVDHATAPIMARALVLASGAERVGLVTLDVLLLDEALVDAIRRSADELHLSMLWVLATHTHASLGGFAVNPVAQVAGTGRFRSETRASLVAAAVQALSRAEAALQPVTLWKAEATLQGWTASRDEFPEVDARLTRLSFRGAAGPVVQLVIFACHPTLVSRPPPGLDPDWPGRLAARAAAQGQGVTLVLQGNVGNVTAARMVPLDGLVEALNQALEASSLRPVAAGLGHATVQTTLPGPDASRLVPPLIRTGVENVLLWPWAPRRAELGLLRIGDTQLLAVPVETTAASGEVLERAAGGARVVALANGYLGYAEPAERVERGTGESRRQLFTAALLDALRAGAVALRGPASPAATANGR
jgi:hypothetical protein